MPLNKEHPTPEVEAVARTETGERNAISRAEEAPDDLEAIAPIELGLRIYAQRHGLVDLSIADLRQASRAAIEALSTKESDLRDENERLREALHNLGMEAGRLVVATDGVERLRFGRQAVLDSLTASAAALQGLKS